MLSWEALKASLKPSGLMSLDECALERQFRDRAAWSQWRDTSLEQTKSSFSGEDPKTNCEFTVRVCVSSLSTVRLWVTESSMNSASYQRTLENNVRPSESWTGDGHFTRTAIRNTVGLPTKNGSRRINGVCGMAQSGKRFDLSYKKYCLGFKTEQYRQIQENPKTSCKWNFAWECAQKSRVEDK